MTVIIKDPTGHAATKEINYETQSCRHCGFLAYYKFFACPACLARIEE